MIRKIAGAFDTIGSMKKLRQLLGARPRAILLCVIGLVVISAGLVTTAKLQNHASKAQPATGRAANNTAKTATPQATPKRAAPAGGTATQDTGASPSPAAPAHTACGDLTLEEAKKYIGPTAKQEQATTPPASYKDVATSLCRYTTSAKALTVTRSTGTGANATSAIGQAFANSKPSGATDKQGYGQQAYWAADKNQFNMLKDNVWYGITLSLGAGSSGDAQLQTLEAIARDIQ
jgi:hypothetical protein